MRASAALTTRLRKLEAPAKAHPRAGVLLLPRMLPPDAWEALAASMQQALAEATMAGVVDTPRDVQPDPMLRKVTR